MTKPRKSTPDDIEQVRATAAEAALATGGVARPLFVNVSRYDLALLAGGQVVRTESVGSGVVVYLRPPSVDR